MHDLPWDTQLFEKKMGKFSHILYKDPHNKKSMKEAVKAGCRTAKEEGYQHVSCTIHPKEMLLAEALADEGFYLKGVLVDYYINLKKFSFSKYHSSSVIRQAKEKDAEKLADIAYSSFSRAEDWYDRFHADTFFSKEKKTDRFFV